MDVGVVLSCFHVCLYAVGLVECVSLYFIIIICFYFINFKLIANKVSFKAEVNVYT
jgi:hypothetical protein